MSEPHRLTNKDVVAREADCSACGRRVDISLKGTNRQGKTRWACGPRRRDLAVQDRIKAGPVDRSLERRKQAEEPFFKQYFTSPAALYNHHLPRDEYAHMFNSQEGRCALCFRRFSERLKPVIDHDHACCHGRSCGLCIRGLLCQKCNIVLGSVEYAVGSLGMGRVYEYLGQ